MTLASLLRSRLEHSPIPAAEAMALALYHPEYGYYRRAQSPWGFDGKDYYTALDCGPLLGQTIALRLEDAWQTLGRPTAFSVLEPGAGRGWLGRELLLNAQGEFAKALCYIHRDDNPAARAIAMDALAPFKGAVYFCPESAPIPPFVGAIISNEFFDAFPAQPWRWNGMSWTREVISANGPQWEPCRNEDTCRWFERQAEGGLEAGDGSVWAQGWPEAIQELAGALLSGLFITIDYGETAAKLLNKGAGLRRYKAHQVDGSWWEDLGKCDMTADVDFTRLEHLLQQAALHDIHTTSLGRWVRQHAPLADWETKWPSLDGAERLKRMENLMALTLPGMMGDRFKVLEAWK